MNNERKLQALNLGSFAEACLLPARVILDKTTQRLNKARTELGEGGPIESRRLQQAYMIPVLHAAGSLWEAYLWMDIGVELGYFPVDASTRLLEHLQVQQAFPKYSDDRWWELAAKFPGGLHAPISEIGEGRYFVQKAYPRFDVPKSTHVPFQALLMMQTDFSRDKPAQDFSTVITFSSATAWSELTTQEYSSERLAEDLARQAEDSPEFSGERMFNGFIRALTYISTFQLLFDGLQGASVISDSDLALLRSRTKEISFWRLNFAHGPAKERFLDMAGLVAKRIVRELAHSETSLSKEPSIENFRSAVVSLVDWWTSEITLSLGRGKTV